MDLTVAAVPGYFGTMGAEYLYLRRRAETQGPSPADYLRDDTVTSLTMGVVSLVAPIAMKKLLDPITPGVGRYGKVLITGAATAVALTTVADALGRLRPAGQEPFADDEVPSTVSTSSRSTGLRSTGLLSPRRRRKIATAARRAA